jgi:hypothetical protein
MTAPEFIKIIDGGTARGTLSPTWRAVHAPGFFHLLWATAMTVMADVDPDPPIGAGKRWATRSLVEAEVKAVNNYPV